jgi:plastocyanin
MNIYSRSISFLLLAAAAWFSLARPWQLPAAVANVSVTNDKFTPATTSINVNDQVLWTWPSGSFDHNVTSTSSPQAWTPSATQNGLVTFSHTFTAAGTFPYDCTIHASIGMKGSVSVAATVNPPPTVALTSPTNGTVLAAPASVTLKAGTTDSAGTVTNVEFLIGSSVVSNCPAAPFVATTNNLAAGSYSLSAVAMDNLGGKATNVVAVSVVTPVPIAISALHPSSGSFQFSYAANIGLNYVVQKTTNLATAAWVPVVTNQAAGSPVIFVDPQATNRLEFYRVGRLPNP